MVSTSGKMFSPGERSTNCVTIPADSQPGSPRRPSIWIEPEARAVSISGRKTGANSATSACAMIGTTNRDNKRVSKSRWRPGKRDGVWIMIPNSLMERFESYRSGFGGPPAAGQAGGSGIITQLFRFGFLKISEVGDGRETRLTTLAPWDMIRAWNTD